jgi:flagellar protein FlgJ
MATGAGALYSDFTGLQKLKLQAREDQAGARTEVARQFESVFIGQMLKAMRAASGGTGILDSDKSRFYRDMYDQQIATEMAKSRGIGMAEAIERQLGGKAEGAVQPAGAQAAGGAKGKQVEDYRASPLWRYNGALVPGLSGTVRGDRVVPSGPSGPRDLGGTREEFLRELWPHAEQAARELGVAPEALLAQAALETGWGRHVMPGPDGQPSYNLFGIKADRSWDGQLVHLSTLEYKDGVAMKTRAAFRAYGSYTESFTDYVEFLKANPRYQRALAAASDPGAFVEELQRAGYATDPAYAAKLKRIMGSEDLAQVRADLKGASTRPI